MQNWMRKSVHEGDLDGNSMKTKINETLNWKLMRGKAWKLSNGMDSA